MLVDRLRRYFPAFAAALAGTVLLTSACGDSDADEPPDRNPDIRGTITELTLGEGDTLGTILVEGEIEPDTQYDKASVRVDKDTEIIMARFFVEPTSAPFSELSKGDLVEVWFEGPVAESYPVQTKAGRIEIISLSTTSAD